MLAVIITLADASAPKPVPPQSAPSVFVTSEKGLTFRTPPGSAYCPLPDDWTGSDHGTVVFLKFPTACYGAGYPSSARGFEPENTPRVEVYYQYWMGDDETPPPCHKVGIARLFSKPVPLCRDRDHGVIVVNVWSRYMADVEAEVSLTLVTTPQREASDVKAFVAMADTVRTCSAEWSGSDDKTKKKKAFVVGVGPRCAGSYF